MKMNIHLLRHIADEVCYSGPLWAQSLFGFEASNGRLVKSVKGCNHVLHQITKKYLLENKLADVKGEANKNLILHRMANIEPTDEEKLILSKSKLLIGESVFWMAVTINGDRYKSTICKETTAIDYFVEFGVKKLGQIKYFVEFKDSVYAMIEIFIKLKTTDHLKEVITTKSLSLIPAHDIKEKLIYMKIGSKEVACNIPNNYEKT